MIIDVMLLTVLRVQYDVLTRLNVEYIVIGYFCGWSFLISSCIVLCLVTESRQQLSVAAVSVIAIASVIIVAIVAVLLAIFIARKRYHIL